MKNITAVNEGNQKEYKFKFLVYPNITYQKDLEKDSFIVVIRNVIDVLNLIRGDIHFTVIVPEIVESLSVLNNVEQVIYEMPSYPNAMRTHFDFNKLMEIIDYKRNDFDVVYSHLPEHTAQLTNLFNNNTNINPLFIGYCHWYEVKENTKYDKDMFLVNISGTLEMEECGVNSLWLKNLVLERSAEYFYQDVIEKLDRIIQPHYLGVEGVNFNRANIEKNSILFNHRDNEYTGWDWFIKTLDSLWEERQDFHLYTTLAEVDKPYATKVEITSRTEYLNFISKIYIGVGCFEKYSAWSIATTDGLSQGIPYLLPNSMSFPEMLPNYPLFYDSKKDFKFMLKRLFDYDIEYGETVKWIKENMMNYLWTDRVSTWFDEWKVLEKMDCVGDSDGYNRLLDFIKTQKTVTKEQILTEMNWGIRIGFSKYRNRLRNEPGIVFTKKNYKFIE